MKNKLSKLTLGALSIGLLSIAPSILLTNDYSDVQFNQNIVHNNKLKNDFFIFNGATASNITATTATIISTFENGIAGEYVESAVLKLDPLDGTNDFVIVHPNNPDYSTNTVSFEATGLKPATNYNISIDFTGVGNNPLGVYSGTPFITTDREFSHTNLEVNNITQETATVTSTFLNATGAFPMADSAVLTYKELPSGSEFTASPTTEDYDSGIITWDLFGLKELTEYEISVEYFSSGTSLGVHTGDNFTTTDNAFAHTDLVASNITSTTAKVTSTFTNATGTDEADNAELTVTPVGGNALPVFSPISPDYASGTLTFDLTGLNPATEYEISVEYFNKGNSLGVHTGDNFTTPDASFSHTDLVASNINLTTATVTSTFTNGTGAEEANRAELTVTPVNGGAEFVVDPKTSDYPNGTLTFDLTGLTPETEYEISVEYFNTGSSLGVYTGGSFTTPDTNFSHTDLVASNITSTTATVTSTFTNSTGTDEADNAELTVTPVGGNALPVFLPISPDFSSGTLKFDLTGLNPVTEYEISVEYFNEENSLGVHTGDSFKTIDANFVHKDLVAYNISQTTATVISTFTNGTSIEEADNAQLTVTPVGGTALVPISPTSSDYASGILTFDLTGLTPETEYEISVEYFNAGASLGVHTGDSFKTIEANFAHTDLVASNITQTTAIVTSRFMQGSGLNEVDNARLKVTPVDDATEIILLPPASADFEKGILTFDLTWLNPSTEYSISIEYFNAEDTLGINHGPNFTTTDANISAGSVEAEWVEDTMKVNVSGFANGSGLQEAVNFKVLLTNVETGTLKEYDDGQITDNEITYELNDLDQSIEYKIEVVYYNSSDVEIGRTDSYTLQGISSGINIGLIAGLSAGIAAGLSAGIVALLLALRRRRRS